MSSTYLHRTLGSTVTVTKITISCWVKRGSLGSTQRMFSHMIQNFAQYFYFRFNSDDTLSFASANTGNYNINYKTNRLFRDTNAWYHLVAKINTSAAGGNRIKIYVNGEQETSFSSSSEPDQSSTFYIGTASDPMVIGGLYGNGYGISGGSSSEHFDGSMSHIHFCDGYDYDASAFGSTDSTTGEWKINTSPSVTYGTNGFFILKDGNSVTDQSGNSNNFTVGGTLTKTEDNPSNVFCTWNPLAKGDLTNNATLSNGNTYYSSDQSGYNIRVGTLGANKGKFYWEGKFISHNPQTSPGMPLGIIASDVPIGTNIAGGQAPYYYSYTYDGSNGSVTYNSTSTNYGTTILDTIGQIGMVAMDLDNNKVYFGVNGVWTNSANPSNGTGGYSIIDPEDTPLGYYLPAVSDRSSIREYVYAWNFGNGYFGTTAVSSAGTNASGIGIFEYDVPTGYTALSTKGLNL